MQRGCSEIEVATSWTPRHRTPVTDLTLGGPRSSFSTVKDESTADEEGGARRRGGEEQGTDEDGAKTKSPKTPAPLREQIIKEKSVAPAPEHERQNPPAREEGEGGGDAKEDQIGESVNVPDHAHARAHAHAPKGEGEGEGVKGSGGVTEKVLRPSIFSIPSIAARALRARLDLWWITSSIDPHFDEKEFLSNAVDAYSFVIQRFNENNMHALKPVLSKTIFNAFMNTWIDYDRLNLGFELSVEKNENPVIVNMELMVGTEDVEMTQEEMDRVTAALSSTWSFESGRGFDSGEHTLRLLVTVRFNTEETARLVNRVTGHVIVTKDLRGSEWTFGRDLPKVLPAREPVASPWILTHLT